MSFDELITLARKKSGVKPHMRNMHLVQDWWPKPKIRILNKKYWGTKHSNNRGILHKYECWSFSAIGFHSGGYRGVQDNPKMPVNVCLAYGESPEEAYDQWCKIFNSWNKKSDWPAKVFIRCDRCEGYGCAKDKNACLSYGYDEYGDARRGGTFLEDKAPQLPVVK